MCNMRGCRTCMPLGIARVQRRPRRVLSRVVCVHGRWCPQRPCRWHGLGAMSGFRTDLVEDLGTRLVPSRVPQHHTILSIAITIDTPHAPDHPRVSPHPHRARPATPDARRRVTGPRSRSRGGVAQAGLRLCSGTRHQPQATAVQAAPTRHATADSRWDRTCVALERAHTTHQRQRNREPRFVRERAGRRATRARGHVCRRRSCSAPCSAHRSPAARVRPTARHGACVARPRHARGRQRHATRRHGARADRASADRMHARMTHHTSPSAVRSLSPRRASAAGEPRRGPQLRILMRARRLLARRADGSLRRCLRRRAGRATGPGSRGWCRRRRCRPS